MKECCFKDVLQYSKKSTIIGVHWNYFLKVGQNLAAKLIVNGKNKELEIGKSSRNNCHINISHNE